MTILVDVGVGIAVEDWLRAAGHNVQAVRDLDPRMSDEDILSLARRERRLVITMDKDFGDLVYGAGLEHCGVLLLRLENAPARVKVAVVAEIMHGHAEELPGRFSVFQNDRLRVRD